MSGYGLLIVVVVVIVVVVLEPPPSSEASQFVGPGPAEIEKFEMIMIEKKRHMKIINFFIMKPPFII
jgi:hypothetical protein